MTSADTRDTENGLDEFGTGGCGEGKGIAAWMLLVDHRKYTWDIQTGYRANKITIVIHKQKEWINISKYHGETK